MRTLVEAIEIGDTGAVWKLARDGAALESVDEATELTPLAIAAEAGQAEIVRILLGAGADPNLGGATTPLEAAVVEGHLEVVEALIGASVDVNQKVGEGFTPLMTAAATGNLQLVQSLLDAGARPRLRNDDGRTAISIAEEAGHDKVVEALRNADRQQREETRARTEAEEEAPADEEPEEEASAGEVPVDGEASADGETSQESGQSDAESGAEEPGAEPGLAASEAGLETSGEPASEVGEVGDPEASFPAPDAGDEPVDGTAAVGVSGIFDLEELVLDGAEDDLASADVESLRVPEESDELSIFTELDGGAPADLSQEDEPLFLSPADEAVPGDRSREELIPAAEVTTTLEDGFGEALAELERLLESGEPEEIRRHLTSAAITEADEAGRTALMAAAHLGSPALVKVLVDAGADVNACDRTDAGQTPLIYAVNSSSPERDEVVSILVAAGADPDLRCGRNQRTALMHAAESDVYLDREQGSVFAQTTKKLIELGADLETTDRRGRTVWRLIKRDALGAPTFSQSRRRLHQMLRVLEYMGARPIASHQV